VTKRYFVMSGEPNVADGLGLHELSPSELCRITSTATLRDQFAMAALTGDVANEGIAQSTPGCAIVAKCAYAMADAMLAARESEVAK
jgi:hypothetical protein